MSRACDRWQPLYVPPTAVSSSQTVSGPWLLMDGASGMSVQVSASGGAAGTLYVDASNIDGQPTSYATPSNVSVAANATATLTFGPADQATVFGQTRFRFVSSAAGNVQIAANVRRVTP